MVQREARWLWIPGSVLGQPRNDGISSRMTSKTTCTEGLPAIMLIAAVAENGVIGSGNALSGSCIDIRRFRALRHRQAGHHGAQDLSFDRQAAQRTHQHRRVSRNSEFTGFGAVVAPSLDAALTAAHGDALRRQADGRGSPAAPRSTPRRCPSRRASSSPKSIAASRATRTFQRSIPKSGARPQIPSR